MRASAHLAVAGLILGTGLGSASRSASAQSAGSADPMTEVAAQAARDFRQGNLQAAIQGFQRALSLTTVAEDQAVLELNLGSALFGLARYQEASTHFQRASLLHDSVRDEAFLNAAAAEMRLGHLDRAEQLLGQGHSSDPRWSSKHAALAQTLADARRQQRRSSALLHMDNGRRALDRGQMADAQRELGLALPDLESLTPEERASLLYALGITELELDDAAAADRHFSQALLITPKDPALLFSQGRAALAQGDEPRARASLERALAVGLAEPSASAARALLERIDPLPPVGWDGVASVGLGYDSNPTQSGAASVTGVGSRGRGGSAYGVVSFELGRVGRWGSNLTGRPYYSGDSYVPWKQSTRELAIQSHALGLELAWATSPKTVLKFGVEPTLVVSGLNDMTFMTAELGMTLGWRHHASRDSEWSAWLEVRPQLGMSDWEYLSGTRLNLELAYEFAPEGFSVRPGLRGRLWAIGTRSSIIDQTSFAACDARCDGAEYQVPLGWAGPEAFVESGLDLTQGLYLGAAATGSLRVYLAPSGIDAIEASQKTRQDQRLTASAFLEIGLDSDQTWLLVPSYDILLSHSNVAYDANDPEHDFDYDDRNFVQQLLELNLRVVF